MIIWVDIMGKKAVKASQNPAKFCGHRYSGSVDIMVLVWEVISHRRPS